MASDEWMFQEQMGPFIQGGCVEIYALIMNGIAALTGYKAYLVKREAKRRGRFPFDTAWATAFRIALPSAILFSIFAIFVLYWRLTHVSFRQ